MIPTLLLALAPALQDPTDATLRPVVEAYLAQHRVPGAVIGFVSDGRPGAVHAYGLARLAPEEPMTPETRFQVGSITKPVTATLLARLVERGSVELDTPLSELLGPDVPEALGGITLWQLATHRSGLPREPANRRDRPDSPSVMQPMSRAELLDGLARTRRAPDDALRYSNLGYALLGAALAEAAGRPYPELVRASVLEPLGMQASGVFLGDATPEGLAACYWPEDEELVEREPWRFGEACAFSGLVSDVADLQRFLCAWMSEDERFLRSETRARWRTASGTPDASTGLAVGAGWFVAQLPGGLEAVAHGGEVDGHSAMMAFYPRLRTGIVVLCNLGDDAAEGLARRVGELALRSWTGGF